MLRKDFENELSNYSFTHEGNNFYVELSDNVAILFSCSKLLITASRLYSTTLKRVINSKDQPPLTTLTEVYQAWKKIYEDKHHFYERQLHMSEADLLQYRIKMSMKIQSQPNFEKSDFLKNCLDNVNKGIVLSTKAEWSITNPKAELTEEQMTFKTRIENLHKVSVDKGDEWTASFAKSILDTINKYGAKTSLSDRQKKTLMGKLDFYSL